MTTICACGDGETTAMATATAWRSMAASASSVAGVPSPTSPSKDTPTPTQPAFSGIRFLPHHPHPMSVNAKVPLPVRPNVRRLHQDLAAGKTDADTQSLVNKHKYYHGLEHLIHGEVKLRSIVLSILHCDTLGISAAEAVSVLACGTPELKRHVIGHERSLMMPHNVLPIGFRMLSPSDSSVDESLAFGTRWECYPEAVGYPLEWPSVKSDAGDTGKHQQQAPTSAENGHNLEKAETTLGVFSKGNQRTGVLDVSTSEAKA
uniref:Uncharacterized protein n=1 Tax=Oryza meridionalis TaxID=40149 RepID=A0A0E0CF42_9ORYZ